MTQLSTNFPDLLITDLEELWDSAYPHEPSMLPKIYDMLPNNGRDVYKFSSVGALPDDQLFNGTIDFQQFYQGYDTTLTPLEFSNGFTVERKLRDDDQYGVYSQRPRQLKESYWRTQERYGARPFNMGFANDTFFYTNTENVALFSNSHTTTVPGVSTSIGFDNKITAALSHTAVATAWILASEFRGDQGEIMTCRPDTLIAPDNLYEEAHEIFNSPRQPNDANNAANVHFGSAEVWLWQYLRDASATNWFYVNRRMMKQWLKWADRVQAEFGGVEDFDTIQLKFRSYSRYGNAWTNWRFGIGSEVS